VAHPSRLAQRCKRTAGLAPPATTAKPLRRDDGGALDFSSFAASLAVTSLSAPLRSRGVKRPSFCNRSPSQSEEGAGKAGCALHPRSRVQNVHKNTHTSIQVQRRHPAFPARWFTAYFVLFPVNGFLATVAPEKLASQELDASTAASEPHDFAVRFSRARQSQPPRPPPPTARS
jgi:hypothetical protein